jgi:cell division protein FtsQ
MLRLPDFAIKPLRYDRISWVVFFFIVVVVLVSAVTRKLDSFAEGMTVTITPLPGGEKLINDSDVRQLLVESFGNALEGTELRRLEVERMERVLEADPFVADADAYIDQHNKLHLRIVQREPMVRILDAQGGNYYLDAEGNKMPASKHFTARVMVATGNIAPYADDFLEKSRNSLKDVFLLSKKLYTDEVWSRFVQQIHVNNAGELVMVPLIGDQTIVLGSARNLDDKLRRLKIFYQEGMPHSGWKTYSSLNVKYEGQVVCRK